MSDLEIIQYPCDGGVTAPHRVMRVKSWPNPRNTTVVPTSKQDGHQGKGNYVIVQLGIGFQKNYKSACSSRTSG